MRVELIAPMNPLYSATETVLSNRGVKNLRRYLNTTDNDINSPLAFGQELMTRAARILMTHIAAEDKTLIIVDADCDGYTSSAVLINYLHEIFPEYVETCMDWFIHSGKQHGLSDCIDKALEYKFVICPDSSSNDYEYHKILKDNNIDVLVLDHHEADHISDYACVVNNQMSDYPNKELSGVGVTWQFCRYLDMIGGNSYADNFLDLVALGNMADMMSLRQIETKHLIFKGFREENIVNPFIYEMAKKNNFSLNKPDYKPSWENKLMITPMGAAFFIAPFVNAMVRSGTQEEKELLFNSMLNFKAFISVPSTKRGHAFGEMERIVDQAVRTCTNVKNRQTKAQDAGMELLEGLIESNNMMEHKVLLFLLEPGEIDRNIAGLVANKIMAKYQRPCCILTKVVDHQDPACVSYQGSARGYDASGITNFKDICAASGAMFAEGHQGAFGLGIYAEDISEFIASTDQALAAMSAEPIYYVDYIWDAANIDKDAILEIADMNDYWGKDIDRSYVLIKNIPVSADTFKVMKSNTLKYSTPSFVDIIQFGGTDEEIEQFNVNTSVVINAVCKCCANEWAGNVNPQLQMVDYEVVIQNTGWVF